MEWMEGNGGKRERERKQISVAERRRERVGECRRREQLNSRRAGVREWVNECVLDLLCPAPEWSVIKLSSSW